MSAELVMQEGRKRPSPGLPLHASMSQSKHSLWTEWLAQERRKRDRPGLLLGTSHDHRATTTVVVRGGP